MHDNVSHRMLAMLSVVAVLAASPIWAAGPELKAIFPCGCRRGESVEVVLAGSGLEQAASLYFSRPGIGAEQQSKGKFRVTVSADVVPGECDVWVASPAGLSGPRRFVIDDIPTVIEQQDSGTQADPQEIPLPGVVDAKLERAADVDWFRFLGRQGQSVTICCRSAALDGSVEPALTLIDPEGRELLHDRGRQREPRLNLQLPRSGMYRLRVCDRAYRSDDYSFYRLALVSGPRLLHVFPHVLTKDTGNSVELFGYDLPGGRVVSSDGTAAASFTAGVAGTAAPQLERLEAEVTAPGEEDLDGGGPLSSAGVKLAGFRFRQTGLQGSLRLGLSGEPVVAESPEHNDVPSSAQAVALPCRIAGRFLTRGDVDWFRMSASRGDVIRLESFGQRLGSPMDLEVAIHDAAGARLTTLADIAAPKDVPATLPLASLDNAGTWKAPADGDFLVAVRDLYGSSVYGPDRIYELLIGDVQPGFVVAAKHPDGKVPRGLSLAAGKTDKLQLIALREGGFSGTINVRAERLPPGVTSDDCSLGPKETAKLMSFTAAADAQPGIAAVRLIAEAEVSGGTVTAAVRGVTLVRGGTAGATRRTEGIVIQVVAPPPAETPPPPEAK